MTTRPTIWPWLKPFVILMLVVSIPPLTYWFVYVKHTVEAAKQQAYTTLAAVATNFKDRLAAHDQIAIAAESVNKANGTDGADLQPLREYLQSVLQPRETAMVPAQTAHLVVGGDSGGLHVQVGKFAKDGVRCKVDAGCSLRAVVALENLISWQIVQPEFDGLLVLSDDGRLLAQDRRLPTQALGIRMAVQDGIAPVDFKSLFGESTTPDGAAKSTATKALSPFDFRTERSIQVAGVDYLVFMQPVSVPVTTIARDSSIDTSKETSPASIRFLVCGLVRKDQMRSEAIKLSPQTLTLAGSLVALGLFSIPFLKLRFIGARERMRRRDVWLLCASLLCVTSLMVLVLLDQHTRSKLRDRFDIGLRQFSLSVTGHLSAESAAALQQLRITATDILKTVEPTDTASALSDNCGATQASGSILAAESAPGTTTHIYAYPDFEAIYITDRCGNQFRKWMPRTTPTPNANSLALPFYVNTLALHNNDYAYSPLTARASGLLLGLFTQPLDLKSEQFGQQVDFSRRTGVVAMATPLRSVNEPVTPPPFQFVLVNRQGEVTFQQAQGPFRGERFFEAVNGGSTLERAALTNAELKVKNQFVSSSIVPREYRGRSYRMNAIDIPELNQTLIAYYDDATVDSLAARILGSAATFAAITIVCILIGAAIAVCWFGERAHDWLWPTPSRSTMYLFTSLLCIVAMAVVASLRTFMPSIGMAAFLLITPIIALVALGSGHVTRYLARIIEQLRLPTGVTFSAQHSALAYQTFAVVGLLAFIAWPTALIVDDAFTLHTTSYTNDRVNEWNLAKGKSQRLFESTVINIRTALPPLNCKGKATGEGRDQRCVLPERTYATQSNYDALLATREKFGVYRNCLTLQMPMRQADADTCTFAAAPWSFTVGVANQLARFSSQPDLVLAMSGFSQAQAGLSAAPLTSGLVLSKWSVGGFLALLGTLALLVASVAKHVLGIGLTNRLALDESSEFAPANETRWLLLRPTVNALTTTTLQTSTRVDLRDATLTPSFVAPGKGVILLIHHIEARIAQPEWRAPLLLLLRTPTAGCVVLSSEIDPLHYLINRVREAEEDMYAAMPQQHAEQAALYRKLQDELDSWAMALRNVRKIRSRIPSVPESATTNAARLAHECSRTEPLMEIGARLAKDKNNLEDYRWSEVVGFVLDAAEPYYRSVWALCSREEQLVLIHLAQEGFVNPKRIEIVKRLARRRLVSVDPRFRLMNESFRRFVSTAETPEHIIECERTPAHSAWARLGTPLYALAAVVIAILLFTEQEMFTSIIAVATGAAGALGSMRNLYSSTVKPVTDMAKNA